MAARGEVDTGTGSSDSRLAPGQLTKSMTTSTAPAPAPKGTGTGTGTVIPSSIRQMSPKFSLFLHDILLHNRIALPDRLPLKKERGMTPEEVFGYLVSFNRHDEWLSSSVPWLPVPGSVYMFNRQKLTNYRKDGHNWMRKKGATNTTRIDRLTLKVFGHDIIHATYCKHEREGRFRRRAYWINENRSTILVHYFLEQKFELLPSLSDSEWRDLLTRSEDDSNEVPAYSEDQPEESLPTPPVSFDPAPSPGLLLSSLMAQPPRKKSAPVPIAPSPQWNLSIIVLRGGNAMIVAYPTLGSGQIVPLGRIPLSGNAVPVEGDRRAALGPSSLKDTIAKMLASEQIPPSAKHLLLQSLLALAPPPSPGGGAGSQADHAPVLDPAFAASLLANLQKGDPLVPPQQQPSPSTLSPPSEPHRSTLAEPPSVGPGPARGMGKAAPPPDCTLSNLLQLIGGSGPILPPLNHNQQQQQQQQSVLEGQSDEGRVAPDYDAQAFSHFARHLSSSPMDPLNPTVAGRGGARHICREAKRTLQHSAPSPTAAAARLPLGESLLASGLLPPPPTIFNLSPSPHAAAPPLAPPPSSAGLPALPLDSAQLSSLLSSPSRLGQPARTDGGGEFTLDGFLEEMDWSDLGMACLGNPHPASLAHAAPPLPDPPRPRPAPSCSTTDSASGTSNEEESSSTAPTTATPPSPPPSSQRKSPGTAQEERQGRANGQSSPQHQSRDIPDQRRSVSDQGRSILDQGRSILDQGRSILFDGPCSPVIQWSSEPAASARVLCSSADPRLSTGQTRLGHMVRSNSNPPGLMASGSSSRRLSEEHPSRRVSASSLPVCVSSDDTTADRQLSGDVFASAEMMQSGMDGPCTGVNASVGSVNASVGSVNASVGSVNASVGSVNASVGSVNASVGTVNASVGSVNASVGTVNASVGTVNTFVDSTYTSVGTVNSSVGAAYTSVGAVTASVASVTTGVSSAVGSVVDVHGCEVGPSVDDILHFLGVVSEEEDMQQGTGFARPHRPHSHSDMGSPNPVHLGGEEEASEGLWFGLESTSHPSAYGQSGLVQRTMPPSTHSLESTLDGTLGSHTSTLGPHTSTLGSHSGTLGPHTSIQGPQGGTLGSHSGTLEPQDHDISDILSSFARDETISASFEDTFSALLSSVTERDLSGWGQTTSDGGDHAHLVVAPPTQDCQLNRITRTSSTVELRLALVRKLQTLLDHPSLHGDFSALYQLCSVPGEEEAFEEAVVLLWRKIFSLLLESSQEKQSSGPSGSVLGGGPALIHLVAGLGMPAFLQLLKKLSESIYQMDDFFSTEFDLLSTDEDHCTAFFWSSSRGHLQCSLQLLHWLPSLVALPDRSGALPLEEASALGRTRLVDHIMTLGDAQSYAPPQSTPSIEVTSSDGPALLPPPPHHFRSTDRSPMPPPNFIPIDPSLVGLTASSSSVSGFSDKGLDTRHADNAYQPTTSLSGRQLDEPQTSSGLDSRQSDEMFLSPNLVGRQRDSGVHFDLSQSLLSLTPSPNSHRSSSPLSPNFPMLPSPYPASLSPSESTCSSLTTSSLSLQETQQLLEAAADSPSVIELCELLSETRNVHKKDFASMELSDKEHLELIRAARTIQSAFRKFSRERAKEKRAALTIESYYKRYREMKRQHHAARVIQQHYRLYKQSMAQDRRRGVERATRVMKGLCRLRENEAARNKIEAFLHLKPPTPGPAIKARVVDNDNGTYSVSFPSVYPGPCVLSIAVNGRDIRGSPFDNTLHHHDPSHRKLSRNIQSIKDPKVHLQFAQKPGSLWGVTVSSKGTAFVSDDSGQKIHVFSKEKKYITSFGTEESGEGQLNRPLGLTVDSDGLVYVANYNIYNGRIDIFREDGTFVRQIGSDQLQLPLNVTIHNLQLYIADNGNYRVSVYTLQGQHVRTIGSEGSGPGQFSSPTGVAFSPDGDMYVTDYKTSRVQVFDANGQYKREFGQGQLTNPSDIVITSDGDVLVADFGNNRVAVFSTCGNTNNHVHSFEVNTPRGLAIDNDGNILVTEHDNKRVAVF